MPAVLHDTPIRREQPYTRYHWDVASFHKLGAGILGEEARVELIDGELVQMAPIGSLHAGKLERLRRLLERAVGNAVLVFSQNPVVLGKDSEPQPDIAVLRPRADGYETAHPRPEDILLLIEVADSSVQYDREIKIPLYARHGIPEVWLLDLQEKRLEVCHELENGEYCQVDYYRKGNVPLRWLAGVTIDLADLF
jgi:Uma2 family endonuclease